MFLLKGASGAYVQVHQDNGNKAICGDEHQIAFDCGDPSMGAICAILQSGDLGRCKKLCTDTADCNYLTFFSDTGCRLYRDCPKETANAHPEGPASWHSSFKKRKQSAPQLVPRYETT